jgi:nicotinamide riboside kinase
MLKVIVTGAFSTGKTTLVGSLADALIGSGITVARLPDVARNCPVTLNSDQTDDASLWLLTTQISREIAAAFGMEQVLLCDRGVPDVLAHHLVVRERDGEGRVALLDRFLDIWLETYDLILLSRVDESVPIMSDGLRDGDAAYRTMLDDYAARVLAGRKGVHELPFEGAQRLDYAREMIARSLASSRSGASNSST